MPLPQLSIYRNKNGNPLVSNMTEPNATPLTGKIPLLGGGGTPQSRYADQQAQLASRSQYEQEVADAAASRQRQQQILNAPQVGMSDDMQQRINAAIEQNIKAGQQDMRIGANAIQAKYANQQLGDLLSANTANAGLMQRGVESGLDMQKFNTGQANDLQSMREKMGFDRQSQEAQFGQQKELQDLSFGQQQKLQDQSFGQQEKLQNAQMGNAQTIAEMKAKNYLTPYEATAQKEKAKNEALIAQEGKRYASTMQMLDSKNPYGANIDKLIANSTGSVIGSGMDAAARSIGWTTDGAKAIAELSPFQGQLIMMMPRGPGAQSDRDIELAKQMAAGIADPTKTVAERQAAYKGLKDFYAQLATKYGYAPPVQNVQQSPQQQTIMPNDSNAIQSQQRQVPPGYEEFTPEEYAAFVQNFGE